MNKRLISLLLTFIVFLSGGIGAFKGANPFNDLQINGTENAEAVAGFTAGNPLAMGVASAAGNAVKQGINKGFDNIDVGEVVVSGTVGLISAGVGKVATKAIGSIVKKGITKAGKIALSAFVGGTIEAGTDAARQGIEILTGVREEYSVAQTVFSFCMGAVTAGFQAEKELKANALKEQAKTVNIDSGKPLQEHHIASNKNSKYTPQFEEITKKYDLDLGDDWNKVSVPHQGRHPNYYHEYVLDSLKLFDDNANGKTASFLKLFKGLKNEIVNNPDILYKSYWSR